MKEIVWSDAAIDQYAAAFDYLAQRNWSAAEKLRSRVRATVEQLSRGPMGRPGHSPDTYEKIVQQTPYLLVFSLVGGELRILRLFHMAQDWQQRSPFSEDDA